MGNINPVLRSFWTPTTTLLSSGLRLSTLIKRLFANSEQGFTQTLDDYSILFQDASGITSVTGTGQTLGLVLDKSRGLLYGSERVLGGNFESGLIGTKSDGSGSSSTWVLNTSSPISGTKDGNLIITTVSTGSYPRLTFTGATKVIGALYEISFSYKVNSGTAVISQIYNGSGTQAVNLSLTGSGIAKIKYIATGTNASELLYFGNSLCNIQIDNFSCKQILGNHAAQSTSSYRPLLQSTPRRIKYDGIDDKLTTTLPAQLTGCTVIRAIPNVGCQILTNQTIPTPYNDSTSHCGLIVINRALTAYETSLVTRIFNKLAGV